MDGKIGKRYIETIVLGLLLCTSLLFINIGGTENQRDEDNRAGIVDDEHELIVPVGHTYLISGVHNYTGDVYVNGTLEVEAYDGTPGTPTGTLRLNARNIYINGLIDGRGRGYGGGGGGGGRVGVNLGDGGRGGISGHGGDGGNGAASAGGSGGGGSNLGQGGHGDAGDGTEDAGGEGGGYGTYKGYPGGSVFGAGGGGGSRDGGGGGGGGGTGGTNGGDATSVACGNGGGGGGSSGGNGGVGGHGDNGRYTAGPDLSSDFNVLMGSGGGGGTGYYGGGGGGGAGGAAVLLNATDEIIINGRLSVEGAEGGKGDRYHGGHGAGGGVAARANNISLPGVIDTRGPGEGGTVKILYHQIAFGPETLIDSERTYREFYNERPVASLWAESDTVIKGWAINISGSRSHDPDGYLEQYYFDFGDGYASGWTDRPTATHAYARSGNYNATLTVKDESGEASDRSAPVAIHVNYAPLPSLASIVISGQIGDVITFNGSASTDTDGNVIEYFFDYGDNIRSGWVGTHETTHVYNRIGAYYVSLCVKDNDGEVSDNNSVIRIDITETGGGLANTRPTAHLIPDRTHIRTGVALVLDGSSSSDLEGEVSAYFFDYGDGETTGWISSSQGTHSYLGPGSYMVTLLVKDRGGRLCQDPAKVSILVAANQPPIPSVLHTPAFISTSVTLSWSRNNDDDFSYYEVHRDCSASFTPTRDTLMRLIREPGTTNITLENILEPHSYYYRIRTIDTAGLVGDSNIVPRKSMDTENNESGDQAIISDETTLLFPDSVTVGLDILIANTSFITIVPPFDAVDPIIFYDIDNTDFSVYEGPISLSLLKEGAHVIGYYSVLANRTELIRSTGFIVDASPPTLNITGPQTDSVSSSRMLEINWNSSDNLSGIDHFELRIDEKPDCEIVEGMTYTFFNIEDGLHEIKIRALDRLGIATEAVCKIKIDATPPDVTILTPTEGMILNTKDVNVMWSLFDAIPQNITTEISMDETPFEFVKGVQRRKFGALAEGPHVVKVRCTDEVGNVNEVTASFTVDTSRKELKLGSETLYVLSGLSILIFMLFVMLTFLIFRDRRKDTYKGKRKDAESNEILEPEVEHIPRRRFTKEDEKNIVKSKIQEEKSPGSPPSSIGDHSISPQGESRYNAFYGGKQNLAEIADPKPYSSPLIQKGSIGHPGLSLNISSSHMGMSQAPPALPVISMPPEPPGLKEEQTMEIKALPEARQ